MTTYNQHLYVIDYLSINTTESPLVHNSFASYYKLKYDLTVQEQPLVRVHHAIPKKQREWELLGMSGLRYEMEQLEPRRCYCVFFIVFRNT